MHTRKSDSSHETSKHFVSSDRFFLSFLILWVVANLFLLTRFPHAHSDEVWLAGLSRAIWETGSLRTTEPFFDLFPRQPHMMKLLYHLVQAPLLTLPGPQLFWARLPSLLAAAAALAILYRSSRRRFGPGCYALMIPVAMGFHVQYLYSAHFARQESMLVFLLLLADDLYDRTAKTTRFWVVPLLIGLGATLHPNALLLAAILGCRLLVDILSGRLSGGKLLPFGSILAGWAFLLIAGSLLLNPSFFSAYRAFGSSLSVDASLASRIQNFFHFFHKLYHQISGTYWLADIRGWFLATGLSVPVALFLLFTRTRRSRREIDSPETRTDLQGMSAGVSGLFGFLAGMLIIGRFNPTAIVFALPSLFRLLAHLIHLCRQIPPSTERLLSWRTRFPRIAGMTMGLVLLGYAIVGGITAISGFLIAGSPQGTLQRNPSVPLLGNPQMEIYLANVRDALPSEAVVLGNLSAGFALDAVPFYDIRNLAPAGGFTPDAAAYLTQRGINTVFWYEEYDYLIRNPQWRILYEAEPDTADVAITDSLPMDSGFLTGLRDVLDRHGTVIYQFEAPVYGTRIIRYMGDTPWRVTVFKIDPAAISETPRSP